MFPALDSYRVYFEWQTWLILTAGFIFEYFDMS